MGRASFPKSRARGSLQEPHPGEKEPFRAFLHCLGPALLAGKAAVIKMEPYFLGVDSFEIPRMPGCMGRGIGSSFWMLSGFLPVILVSSQRDCLPPSSCHILFPTCSLFYTDFSLGIYIYLSN